MTGNKFRRIYSAPLALINLLKKSNIDNFLGGLIIGSIFSLLVNVLTNQLQDQIARQQYFESLEHEIVENYFEAKGVIDSVNKLRTEKKEPSFFAFTKRYHTNIWDSGNALDYIYTLDPKLQDQMAAYYSVGIARSNRYLDYLQDSVNDLATEKQRCVYVNVSSLECAEINVAYNKSMEYYEELQLKEARYILAETNKLLDDFHPTKDRIQNPMLKMFMGTRASNIFILDPAYKTKPKTN